MKAISGKRLCRLVEAHGWRLARVRGSHHIFTKPGTDVRSSVPVHGNRTLKRGLKKHLMKLAEIEEADMLGLPPTAGDGRCGVAIRPEPSAFL